MKAKNIFLAACMMLGAVALVWAADVSGKWVAQVPGRDGQTRETAITLKVEGKTLTGSIGGQQGDTAISEGKIEGDDLSFTVVRNMNGNEIKLLYKGKVAGDEIKFSRTRVGGDQPAQEFTAKRTK